jgi:hypothetical protein
MIQRVQSIYLLLAIIAVTLIFFIDLAYFEAGGSSYAMDLYSVEASDGGEEVATPAYWLWSSILVTVLDLVLIAALFLFKQRMKQLRLVHLSYLLEAGAIVLLTFSIDHSGAGLVEDPSALSTSYWIAWYMPVVAFAFSFLAARGIKKDEELVRSVDRLR